MISLVTSYLIMEAILPFKSSGMPSCDSTRARHSFTLAIPSPTAAAPTPRCGMVTLRKMPTLASSAISRSIIVDDVLRASICAIVTKGGILRLKLSTSAILAPLIPVFSGKSLNILLRMCSMYWGTSRKLRSVARDTITPVSSNSSSSSYEVDGSEGRVFFRGLVPEGDDVDRFSPKAAAALVLLVLVIREERAGVAWKDMFALHALGGRKMKGSWVKEGWK